MTSATYDFIIVGQGTAGTTLAWRLAKRGQSVLIIDRGATTTCSRIAAGLITPVTGQRLVVTWRWAEFWPVACQFYGQLQQQLADNFFHRRRMLRLFQRESERELFAQRRDSDEFRELVDPPTPLIDTECFANRLGGFEMLDAGQLDVARYLDCSRAYFSRQNSYLTADLRSDDIQLTNRGVDLPRLNVSGRTLVFCEGAAGRTNPWFSHIRFDAAKGEVLKVQVPGLNEPRVIHSAAWLAPTPDGDSVFRVGATYNREQLDELPTAAGRSELAEKLADFLELPFEILDHQAAVRPIVVGRHPVMGLHHEYPQLGYFNGFASKGSLQAPYFAAHFADHLLGPAELELTVDLQMRFFDEPQIDDSTDDDAKPIRLTERAHRIVREVLRPDETAVDATAGNGRDTLVLANCVGEDGHVFACDVQEAACQNTADLLRINGFENCTILCRNHAELADVIPADLHGEIGAVMFNLGYLPGGEKSIVTETASTIPAVQTAYALLRPGGVLTVLVYRGHPGGAQEAASVESKLRELSGDSLQTFDVVTNKAEVKPPRLLVVRKSR